MNIMQPICPYRLSPSIEGQRVYRRSSSKDKNDLVVEIKAEVENQLQIEVFSR